MRYTEDGGTTPSVGARNPTSWVRRSAASATIDRTSSCPTPLSPPTQWVQHASPWRMLSTSRSA